MGNKISFITEERLLNNISNQLYANKFLLTQNGEINDREIKSTHRAYYYTWCVPKVSTFRFNSTLRAFYVSKLLIINSWFLSMKNLKILRISLLENLLTRSDCLPCILKKKGPMRLQTEIQGDHLATLKWFHDIHQDPDVRWYLICVSDLALCYTDFLFTVQRNVRLLKRS